MDSFEGVGIFTEDGNKKIEDFFHHARQLGSFVHGVEKGAREIVT
jgi:hypothetical protein